MYNSGVVTEGPGSGPPLLAGPRSWFGGMFDGSRPWFGGDAGAGSRCAFESDHCFDSFVSPVTNPFFFEDPRSLTELRPVFLYQKIESSNPHFKGGKMEMFALQARLALTDRFSIVMPKLGFVAIQPDNPALSNENGLAELMIGPKYTFWRDDQSGTIAAIGLNLEIPIGDSDVFQDTGSGAVAPHVSLGQQLGNFHLLGSFGYRFGFDDERSDSLFVSAHLDYSFFDRIYPFVELNWFHYTDNGTSRAANFEGADLINFGSDNVKGENLVSLGLGLRFKITESIQAGVAYEFPLTSGDDFMDYRITADIIFRY